MTVSYYIYLISMSAGYGGESGSMKDENGRFTPGYQTTMAIVGHTYRKHMY